MIAALLLAAAFQDIGSLDRAVAAFTARPLGAEGGARSAIDPRLRLAACPTVSMSWRTQAHDAVVVSCSGPDWRLFVPVIAAPRTAGTPAPAVAAKAAPVIRRGDPVTVEAGTPGFSVTRDGVAMGDAAAGAHFAVKMDDSPRPIQAVAVEAGRASLPGWTG